MTLAQRNATEALPELRWLLENRNAARRAIGILALSKMRDRKAIPTLVRLIEDPVFAVPTPLARWHADYPSPRVWHFAVDGLERITGTKTEGRTVADRRAFWRQWYGENR